MLSVDGPGCGLAYGSRDLLPSGDLVEVSGGLKEDCLEQTSEGCWSMFPARSVDDVSDLGSDTVDDEDWF